MLGFILSKVNLLILVVSVFAIVSFFLAGLSDLARINEARLLLDRVSQKAFALVSSPSYCFSDSFDLPRQIRVAGEDYYFVLKISVEKIEKPLPSGQSELVSVVIFSLHPRVDYLKHLSDSVRFPEPASIAASSFRVAANVSLFSDNYVEGRYERSSLGPSRLLSPDAVIVDPNAENPYNNVEFLKEIRNGVSFVYIFPCNVSGCEETKQRVSVVACNQADIGQSLPDVVCPGSTGFDSGDVWFNC